MANLKLNNVTIISETGGVATFANPSSTLVYPPPSFQKQLATGGIQTSNESGGTTYIVHTFLR